MENQDKDQGRENFDTENRSAPDRSYLNGDGSSEEKSTDPTGQPQPDDIDMRYDTNPNRNNFGAEETPSADDSPLNPDDWNKDEQRSHQRESHDDERDDDFDAEDSDSSKRDNQNLSFDRDL